MSWSNADEASKLLKNSIGTYGEHRKSVIASAQVYALLAIADAITGKED